VVKAVHSRENLTDVLAEDSLRRSGPEEKERKTGLAEVVEEAVLGSGVGEAVVEEAVLGGGVGVVVAVVAEETVVEGVVVVNAVGNTAAAAVAAVAAGEFAVGKFVVRFVELARHETDSFVDFVEEVNLPRAKIDNLVSNLDANLNQCCGLNIDDSASRCVCRPMMSRRLFDQLR
jgi:hypothetical protein